MCKAFIIFEQHGHIDVRLFQSPKLLGRNRAPVTHEEAQDVPGLIVAVEGEILAPSAFRKAISIDDSEPLVHRRLAEALEHQGKIAEP